MFEVRSIARIGKWCPFFLQVFDSLCKTNSKTNRILPHKGCQQLEVSTTWNGSNNLGNIVQSSKVKTERNEDCHCPYTSYVLVYRSKCLQASVSLNFGTELWP